MKGEILAGGEVDRPVELLRTERLCGAFAEAMEEEKEEESVQLTFEEEATPLRDVGFTARTLKCFMASIGLFGVLVVVIIEVLQWA